MAHQALTASSRAVSTSACLSSGSLQCWLTAITYHHRSAFPLSNSCHYTTPPDTGQKLNHTRGISRTIVPFVKADICGKMGGNREMRLVSESGFMSKDRVHDQPQARFSDQSM